MRILTAILLVLGSATAQAQEPLYITDAYSGGYQAPFYGKVVGRDAKQTFILMDDAADAYERLQAAANKAGFRLVINSAYRSTADQHRMMKQRRRWAAAAGYSMHQSGRAIDIAGMRGRCRPKRKRVCKSALFAWLKENAPAYGWHNSAPKEPWHWTYHGTDFKTALKGYGRGLGLRRLGQPPCAP
jgi:LAS superfamily LD-carboxypeptidase LdcB